MEKQNIVVLGAGYGGIRFTKRINALLGKQDKYQVILVNKHNFHYFKTQLYELAAGTTDVDNVRVSIAEVLDGTGAEFIKGEVEKIDTNQRLVSINNGKVLLPFKYLVVALGADPNYFNIEGLEQHSFVLSSLYSARQVRDEIEKVLTTPTDRPITFVVCGGGLTGVEFVGELAYRLQHAAHKYDLGQRDYKIIIIEAGSQLLPGMSKAVADYAYKILTDYGVEVITSDIVKRVTDSKVFLASEKEIDYSFLLWAGGVRANRLLDNFGLKLSPKGQLMVNRYLQCVDDPYIYALGDSAFVTDPQSGNPVLPTAQASLQQAKTVADNIYADITGNTKKAFNPELIMFFITIGKGRGLAEGYGKAQVFKLKGKPASWGKKLIPIKYNLDIGGTKMAVRSLFRPRRIMQ